VKKVIISRSRYLTMCTHKLLLDYSIVCPESEVELYRQVVSDKEIIPISDSIYGLSCVRNWCLDNIEGDFIMLDDDIEGFYYVNDIKARRIRNPLFIEAVLENTYINAVDSGATLFGISQSGDPRKYNPQFPFNLSTWVGAIVGVIGRDFRWDERLKIRTDVDYSLQVLSKKRFVWVESRYAFFSRKDYGTGGSTVIRTSSQITTDKNYVKRKWGANVKFGSGKNKDKVNLFVDLKNTDIYKNL